MLSRGNETTFSSIVWGHLQTMRLETGEGVRVDCISGWMTPHGFLGRGRSKTMFVHRINGWPFQQLCQFESSGMSQMIEVPIRVIIQ